MIIPPKYTLTSQISQLLSSIEASKQVIDAIEIIPEVEINIRRASILKSSLFSARIEGNSLTIDDITTRTATDQKKVEVSNILKALQLVQQKKSKNLSIKDICTLHGIVMNGLIGKENLGKFRTEVSAIFNAAGMAIYLPPPPKDVKHYMQELCSYVNNSQETLVPIKAILAHYSFEKIHPFLDGNGRIGRLILQAVLHMGGYSMKGILPLEEYLDKHRLLYYQGLEDSDKDVTNYLTFILEALAHTAEQTKNMVLQKKEVSAIDCLLPRRAEIYNIVQDHDVVNFDQIRRRFMAVNERTLRYDLKYLCDKGLITKLGTTKGVYYKKIA